MAENCRRLAGKVVIVTGGGHGLGKAYALALAEEGAKVVVADINGEATVRVAEEIKAKGGEALASRTDVTDEASTLAMAKTTIELFSRIDVLINNAAIIFTVKVSRVPLDEIAVDEWDKVMAVNVKGAFLCSKAVLPQMKVQGSGKIINVSSSSIIDGSPLRAHYVASKAAVVGLTRSLSREVGDFNITVNCLAPGSILSAPDDPDAVNIAKRTANTRSLKRVGYPSDLVGTVIFLSSSESDFMTGQTLVVNGGGKFV